VAGELKNGADAGPGPAKGAVYLKSALKKYAREHPLKVKAIVLKIFQAATDEEYAKDRLAAATFIRDTIDGRPQPEIHIDSGPKVQVYVVEDYESLNGTDFPESVMKMLEEKPRTIDVELEETEEETT